MSAPEAVPRHGDGYARVLLGLIGTALVAGGMVITWLIVSKWPMAFLAATPGLAFIGYGVALLLACAFYDDVDVTSGPLGIPIVRVKPRRQQQAERPNTEEPASSKEDP